MKIRHTERGFPVVEFKDFYGKECSLQKSSLADREAVWLGVDNTGMLGTPKREEITHGRMHLTQDQVKKLLPHLIKFADTGDI